MRLEIGDSTIHTPYVFVVPSNTVDTIGWSETTYITPEITTNNWIELSINDISREEDEVRLECIYFLHDASDMSYAICWPQMYITCNSDFEAFCDLIFFLYFELISADLGISGIDVPESDGDDGPNDSHVGEVVADGLYLFSWEPSERIIHPEKYIIEEADQKKVDDAYKPEWTKCDQKIWNNRASTMLYHLTENIWKGKTEKERTKNLSSYTKIFCHIPPVHENIPIYKTVEDYKNTKEEEKIGMTHVLQMKNEQWRMNNEHN